MAVEFLALLSEPAQSLLLGAAANFSGGLAADLVRLIVGAAGHRIRKRLGTPAREQALNRAMAEALARVVSGLTDDPDHQAHYLTLLGDWIRREAVSGELTRLVDPQQDPDLDLDLLRAEFQALDRDPDLLGEDVRFAAVVLTLVSGFTQAAGREPALQEEIQIGLLRRLVDLVERLAAGSAPQPQAALAPYLKFLAAQARQLPLRGKDLAASDPGMARRPMELDRVYVALDTTETTEEGAEGQLPREWAKRIPSEMRNEDEALQLAGDTRRRPLRLLEAVAQKDHLVILGGPGSGKSTFCNHLVLCLALHRLEPHRGWRQRLDCWPEAEPDLIPLPVVLRDFAQVLPETPGPGTVKQLWSYVAQWLDEHDLSAALPILKAAVADGTALVLLDGLDEVTTHAHRVFLRELVLAFATRYSKSRVLVTCRTLSYEEDPAWQIPNTPSVRVAPFDRPKIDAFIEGWYDELNLVGEARAEDLPDLKSGLRTAVRRPDIRELAPNPLLLTVMALVHAHGGKLPEARALLYKEAVDVLLWRWEQAKTRGKDAPPPILSLLKEAGREGVDLLLVLGELAFQVHAAQPDGTADGPTPDIAEHRLLEALAGLFPGKEGLDWAKRLVGAIKLRAGLLVERSPQVFAFPHRTFQEYLAGTHLAGLPDFTGEAVRRFQGAEYWRTAILLGVGRLVYVGEDIARPLNLVAELVGEHQEDSLQSWRQVLLAGEALLEMKVNRARDSVSGRELVGRVGELLEVMVSGGHLSPAELATAGDILARIGDPRCGVGIDGQGLPDIAWCDIPTGPFPMGNDDIHDPAAHKDEAPRHPEEIPEPYHIARYPVTNTQFDAFVKDGGYTDKWRDCWTMAGWDWKGLRTGPEMYGGAFDLPNHPVVGVSWYEAAAFCKWLARRFGHPVFLPTEAQWERAARHIDGRRYPWGNEEDVAARCNIGKTGIGQTTAVGLLHRGDARCGAADMAGNVWEWCRTKWRGSYEVPANEDVEGDDARVLRGGAFDSSAGGARCAYRSWDSPNGWFRYFGFRVAASPRP